MAWPEELDNLFKEVLDGTISLTNHKNYHNSLADAINRIEEALGIKMGNVDTATPSLKLPPRPQKTVIQQFQPGHAFEKYSGTGTFVDAEDSVIGKQSIKILTLEDESQTKVRKKTVGPYDFTGKDLEITFKISNLPNIGVCEIYLSSDNLATNNVHYRFCSSTQPYISDGEWATITIPWGDLANASPAGTINRAAVNYIEFRFEAQLGKTAELKVNEVAAVPTPSGGVVSLVFDDGWASTYERARPFMDTFGYRGTSCIIRDVVGTANYMTLAQVRALQDKSFWDVCAHADTVANHNAGYATLTNAAVEEELKRIKRWLIENNFKRRDLFMWPKGEFDAAKMAIAQKFFNAIRGTTGGKGGNSGAHETFPPGESFRLRTFLSGGSTITAAEIETAVNECKKYNTWLILSYHQIVAAGAAGGTQMNEAVFKEHIEKVAASGLPVKTVCEVLES
jgi:hypothetical protein